MGRLYVYTEEWNNVISCLEQLTKPPYAYSLTKDYFDNFDLEHEYNSESIFEVAYQKIGAATGRWDQETANTMMTTPMNRTFASNDVGGWDVINCNEKMLDILTSELDRDGNFDVRTRVGVAWNYSGCIYYMNPFTETVTLTNQSKIFIRKYTYCNYLEKEKVPESEINVRAYRYANVLLFLAEAELNTENKTKAIGYLNQVRERANLNLLPLDSTEEEVKQDLIKQRAIEFFCEGERFYDLRRWGLLEDEIKKIGGDRAASFQQKHYYLPIPSQEIQTNKLCEQSLEWR
ncbi:MAG: RagB/SusD family nutrient uptake outer membrane protein [Mangrovibacterium sp.]